jgi:hypothetical protein
VSEKPIMGVVVPAVGGGLDFDRLARTLGETHRMVEFMRPTESEPMRLGPYEYRCQSGRAIIREIRKHGECAEIAIDTADLRDVIAFLTAIAESEGL